MSTSYPVELIAKRAAGSLAQDTVTLTYHLRQRSRQRLTLDSGRAAALLLTPGTRLDDGDQVQSADGFTVTVRAALEPVSVARTRDVLQLGRACYHLGNRHVALQVGEGWVRYHPDHVLDEMVRGLGLDVTTETVPFEPERGAYGGAAHTHTHAGGHEHSHHHHALGGDE